MSDQQITTRVPPALLTRLKRATDRKKNPLAPTISQLLNAGLELILTQLEKKQ